MIRLRFCASRISRYEFNACAVWSSESPRHQVHHDRSSLWQPELIAKNCACHQPQWQPKQRYIIRDTKNASALIPRDSKKKKNDNNHNNSGIRKWVSSITLLARNLCTPTHQLRTTIFQRFVCFVHPRVSLSDWSQVHDGQFLTHLVRKGRSRALGGGKGAHFRSPWWGSPAAQ